MAYAAGTDVSEERSRSELDRLLGKAGAGQRMIGVDEHVGVAFAAFMIKGTRVKIQVPLPDPKADEFMLDPRSTWKKRSESAARNAYEQATRQRWRAMVLLVKAKLEIVELGISTIEREFLADTILPGGKTVYEQMRQELVQAASANAPLMLGAGK